MCQNSTSNRRLLAEEDSESATQHQAGKQGRERVEDATSLHCNPYLLPRRGVIDTAIFNRYETIEIPQRLQLTYGRRKARRDPPMAVLSRPVPQLPQSTEATTTRHRPLAVGQRSILEVEVRYIASIIMHMAIWHPWLRQDHS